MKRVFRFFTIACASFALAATQTPGLSQGGGIRFSDVAGTWEGKSMVGPKDSVFVTWALTATADGIGWTLKRANRDPLPVRIIAIGRDSIVWESGPYPSILRAGQMVTTRTAGHFKGDKMTGSWEGRYAPGDVVRGKTEATRKK